MVSEKIKETNNLYYWTNKFWNPFINEAHMSSIYPITSLWRFSRRDNTIDKLQMFKRWQCHSIWVRAGAESNEHVVVDSSSTPDLWPFWQQPWWNSWYARDSLWVLQPQELTRRWCSSSVLPGALLSLFFITPISNSTMLHLIAKETEQEKRFLLLLSNTIYTLWESQFCSLFPCLPSYKKHKNFYERQRGATWKAFINSWTDCI